MECWSNDKMTLSQFLSDMHYSITPQLHYSKLNFEI